MSNNVRLDPSKDEIRLIQCDSTQSVNSMAATNPNANLFNTSCGNGIIFNENNSVVQLPSVVPVSGNRGLVLVSPRKIIVPINHIGQSVVTSNGQPQLKRYVNGDCKTTYSYRAMASEIQAQQQQAILINAASPTCSINKTSIAFHPTTTNSPHVSRPNLVCPSCNNITTKLNPCDSCKKSFSTISVIRPTRQPNSVLCATNSQPNALAQVVTMMNSVNTNKTITTVVKPIGPGRTRPSIISGSRPNATAAISSQSFYGDNLLKVQENIVATCSSGGLQHFVVNQANYVPQPRPPIHSLAVPGQPKQMKTRKQVHKTPPEPECLTISSDEEEAPSSQSSVTNSGEAQSTTGPNGEECSSQENGDASVKSGTDGGGPMDNNEATQSGHVSTSEDERGIRLMCRSIRIGSYKVQSPDPPSLALDITPTSLKFSVPEVGNESQFVSIEISTSELPSLMICFEKRLFVMFLYTTSDCGAKIRAKLKMTKDTVYYDPSMTDDTKKRIVILPGNISDTDRAYLRRVYVRPMICELHQCKANEILVKSTPSGGNQHLVRLSSAPVTRSKVDGTEILTPAAEVKKLCTFPPPPQTGGITITTEDLACLNPEEYLNDVIIDFYLKYIYYNKLSKEDQNRTHIFSSFFFNRLSQAPTKTTQKNLPKTGQKETRHTRVKNWTRHVDIFDKDFLIVPVNQSSHWFLVVICFPGRVDPNYKPVAKEKKVAVKTESDAPATTSQQCQDEKNASSNVTEKSALDMGDPENPLPPVKSLVPYPLDDQMEVDEEIENPREMAAEVPSQLGEATGAVKPSDHSYSALQSDHVKTEIKSEIKTEPDENDKRPCIIVFDSLPGTSRWRVVNYLREYLEVEHLVKKNQVKHFDRESMKGLNARVARQDNFSDCGVYLLQYAESFFENPLESYTMPLKDLRDWFSGETVNNKRECIKNLILELSNQK